MNLGLTYIAPLKTFPAISLLKRPVSWRGAHTTGDQSQHIIVPIPSEIRADTLLKPCILLTLNKPATMRFIACLIIGLAVRNGLSETSPASLGDSPSSIASDTPPTSAVEPPLSSDGPQSSVSTGTGDKTTATLVSSTDAAQTSQVPTAATSNPGSGLPITSNPTGGTSVTPTTSILGSSTGGTASTDSAGRPTGTDSPSSGGGATATVYPTTSDTPVVVPVALTSAVVGSNAVQTSVEGTAAMYVRD